MEKPIDFVERQRILQLQKDYKNGKITEEEMTLEDMEAVIKLYEIQNRELRKELARKLLRGK